MSNEHTIARPYASALFDLAQELKELPSWLGYLTVAAQLDQYEGVSKFLANPRLTYDQVEKLIGELAANEQVQKELSQSVGGVKPNFNTAPTKWQAFLKRLENNDRLEILPVIGELFVDTIRSENSVLPVVIYSAQSVNEDEKEKISQRLVDKFEKQVDISIETDESLIGGMVVKVGDTVIDGSVKGKLDAMRQSLLN